ncbi:MAG: MoaD/ThiS family protein [Pelolinea sp.]|nr:MoaD/ThiS family protein [Pelolinea sp.]
MSTNQVLVEFTGISRVLTGKTEYMISIANNKDVTEVVRMISRKFPALLGEVIERGGETLIPTNLFSVNGERILNEEQLHYKPKDGDRLILLSLLAGG